jgi:hypothetical protein
MIGGILTVLNLLFVHFFNTIILCFDENLLNFPVHKLKTEF